MYYKDETGNKAGLSTEEKRYTRRWDNHKAMMDPSHCKNPSVKAEDPEDDFERFLKPELITNEEIQDRKVERKETSVFYEASLSGSATDSSSPSHS